MGRQENKDPHYYDEDRTAPGFFNKCKIDDLKAADYLVDYTSKFTVNGY